MPSVRSWGAHWALMLTVFGACDDAVVGRLGRDASSIATSNDAGDDASRPDSSDAGENRRVDAGPDAGPPAPVCVPPSQVGDAAVSEPLLAYGGASAGNGTIASGRRNGGRQFEVTEDCVYIIDLAVWDHNQDGLSRAHPVTLFAIDRVGVGAMATPIPGATAQAQAGSAVPLEDGFRLATLARPVLLPRGLYAVVAYDFSTEEPYGDGGTLPDASTGIKDLNFDPFESSMDPSPDYPSGGDSNSHSMASFRYAIGKP